MERLTKRDEFGNADIIGVDSADLQLNLEHDEFNKVTDALNKLADYEDAEEQGLLLRLPCKVGTEVWEIKKLFWVDRKSCKECIYFGDDGLGEYCDYDGDNYPTCTKIVPKKFTMRMLEEIGKTVFLTEEEAEQNSKTE